MPKREIGRAIEGNAAVSVRLLVATHMFIIWSRIALKREHEAHEARAKMMRTPSASAHLGDETEATLQAVVATASALEALRHEIAHKVAPASLADWEAGPRGTAAQVLATLSLGFGLEGEEWQPRLDALFRRRNQAVHPRWRQQETMPHPSGLHNTSHEHAEFASERAQEACDLLLDLLDHCAGHPRPDLEKWAADVRPSLLALHEIRQTSQIRRHLSA
jgi:hypothetical protein